VEAEKVKSFEGGLKSTIFGGRMDATLAAFHYKYSNIQVSTNVNGIGVLQNAAAAKIKGLELAAAFRVTDELTLSSGLSVLDAKYGDFPGAIVTVPKFLNGRPNGTANATVNLTGYSLVRSPKWTLNVGADYRKSFSAGELDANVLLFTSGKFYYDIYNRIAQGAYTTVNATIGFTPAGSRFRVAVWGRNLTDEAVYSSVFINAAADGAAYAPPRQIGVSVGYKF